MRFIRWHGKYDTKLLWEITSGNTRGYVHVSDLKHFMDVEIWSEGTPNEVLDGKVADTSRHLQRVQDADLSMPLLLGPEYGPAHVDMGRIDLYDGLHRLAKALRISYQSWLPFVWVSRDQLLKAKIDSKA